MSARCCVVSLTQERLRRDRGGPEPRNNRNRGRSKTKQWAEPHTQIRRELTTRNRLRQQDKYNVVRDYNRQAGKRPRANTHTHTHTNGAQWNLCRKHSGFPRSRGNLPKPIENKHIRGESSIPSSTAVRPRQNVILFLPFPLDNLSTSSLFSVPSDRDTPRFSPN